MSDQDVTFGWVIYPVPRANPAEPPPDPNAAARALMEANERYIREMQPHFDTVWVEDHFQWDKRPVLEAVTTLGAIGDARALVRQLREVIDRLSPIAARLETDVVRVRDHVVVHDPAGRASDVLAKLRAAIDKIDPLLATAQDLAARFARHEGTIGRLMHDPEFPEDAKELGKILKRRPWRVIAKPRD